MSEALHLTIATPASLLVDAEDVRSLRAEDFERRIRRPARSRRSPDRAAAIGRALDARAAKRRATARSAAAC